MFSEEDLITFNNNCVNFCRGDCFVAFSSSLRQNMLSLRKAERSCHPRSGAVRDRSQQRSAKRQRALAQRPSTNYQLSTISYQLSTISYQLSTISFIAACGRKRPLFAAFNGLLEEHSLSENPRAVCYALW
jgi:hypothetical protein